jgi:hypothetical protein
VCQIRMSKVPMLGRHKRVPLTASHVSAQRAIVPLMSSARQRASPCGIDPMKQLAKELRFGVAQKVYWLTISRRGETGGERPHKMKALLSAF